MKKLILTLPLVMLLIGCSKETSSLPLESSEQTVQNVASVLNLSDDQNITSLKFESFSIRGTGVYVAKTSEYSGDKVNKLYRSLLNVELSLEKEDFRTIYGGQMSIYYFDDIEIKFWDNYLFIENVEVPYMGDFYRYETRLPYEQADKTYLNLHIDSTSAVYDGTDVFEEMKAITFETYQSDDAPSEPPLGFVSFDSERMLIYSSTIFSFATEPEKYYQLSDTQTFSFI